MASRYIYNNPFKRETKVPEKHGSRYVQLVVDIVFRNLITQSLLRTLCQLPGKHILLFTQDNLL